MYPMFTPAPVTHGLNVTPLRKFDIPRMNNIEILGMLNYVHIYGASHLWNELVEHLLKHAPRGEAGKLGVHVSEISNIEDGWARVYACEAFFPEWLQTFRPDASIFEEDVNVAKHIYVDNLEYLFATEEADADDTEETEETEETEVAEVAEAEPIQASYHPINNGLTLLNGSFVNKGVSPMSVNLAALRKSGANVVVDPTIISALLVKVYAKKTTMNTGSGNYKSMDALGKELELLKKDD